MNLTDLQSVKVSLFLIAGFVICILRSFTLQCRLKESTSQRLDVGVHLGPWFDSFMDLSGFLNFG